MIDLGRDYWEERYVNEETGWDIGYPSTPLKDYIDQIEDKSTRILVPGGGNGYEVQYLHEQGFTDVHIIDLTPSPFERLREACPDFPEAHLHVGDFFDHHEYYDLVLEQTFFCALDPSLRKNYVAHVAKLLRPKGKLVGVLFNDPLFKDHPPFGGNAQDYRKLFKDEFLIEIMETAYNSIKPRTGRELFVKMMVKN